MKLVICGNGFDQHHRLPTNYTDYCLFLNRNHPDIIRKMKFSDYFGGASTDINQTTNVFWTDVEGKLTYDFEAHLDNTLEEFSPNYMDEKTDYGGVEVHVEEGLSTFEDFTGLPFYEWLMTIPVSGTPQSSLFTLSPDDYYVTYNYTDTLETVYGIPKDHILHIHGSICDLKNPKSNFEVHSEIQFGNPNSSKTNVEQILDSKYKNTEEEYFVRNAIPKLARTCEAMSKDLKSNYQSLRRFLSGKTINEVVVMGHSFLGVDKAYYDDIFVKQFRGLPWSFYWYSPNDLKNIQQAQSIFNLSNVNSIRW